MIRLGFHLSIAGSVANAPKEAAERGYGAFQIFTSNPRAWKSAKLEPSHAREFARLTKELGLASFAHMPYLCNLSTMDKGFYDKSIQMLIDNIRNCMELKIPDLVMHLGSHGGRGADIGINQICDALVHVLDETKDVHVLLENSSGYKNSVGSRFEEIAQILEQMNSDRIGVCFDTCHAFAAGYDISTERGVLNVEEQFNSLIGKRSLRLIHLNDAHHPLGSGLDRHWHIGEGYIGEKGFEALFRTETFGSGSFIMETPSGEWKESAKLGESDDRNIIAARRILKRVGKRESK